jgi:hypothetical protein
MDCEATPEQIQRRIQNQVRVHSSLYTMQLSALNNTVNNDNVGVKHGSYERRLQKLKYNNMMKSKDETEQSAIIGGKTKSYNITSHIDSCNC